MVGIPATAILLSLVIKSRTELTNSSIYLASLSIASLLQLLTAVPLLVYLLARQWIMGDTACSLAAGIMTGGPLVSLCCHLLLSRDKYKAMKHSSQWEWIKSKKAYVYTVSVWVASLLVTVFAVGFDLKQRGVAEHNATDFSCFIVDSSPRPVLKTLVLYGVVITNTLVHLGLILATIVYHVLLHRELRSAARKRLCVNYTASLSRQAAVNCIKIPGAMYEQRTAKSLLVIFLIQAIASTVMMVFELIQLMKGAPHPAHHSHVTLHSIAVLCVLSIYYIPTLNPAILIVSSSRYRRRVINLLKCRYTAESDDSRHVSKASARQLTKRSSLVNTKVKLATLSKTPQHGLHYRTGDEASVHTSSLTISLSPGHLPQQHCWEEASNMN